MGLTVGGNAMNKRRVRKSLMIVGIYLLFMLALSWYEHQPIYLFTLLSPFWVDILPIIVKHLKIKDLLAIAIYFWFFFVWIYFSGTNGGMDIRLFSTIAGSLGTLSSYYIGKYLMGSD